MTSLSEAGLGAKPVDVLVEGLALPAKGTGRLLEGGGLGMVTGAVLAAGSRAGHRGSGAKQPEMASVSPHKAARMLWSLAFFSASQSLAVTRKPR